MATIKKPSPVSRQEIRVRKIVASVLPGEEVAYNARPPWLRNPKTGYNMELDIYYPKLNFAIEYNGWQHHQSSPEHGITISEVKAQRSRDARKYKLCRGRGVHLLVVRSALAMDSAALKALVLNYVERAKNGKPAPLASVAPLDLTPAKLRRDRRPKKRNPPVDHLAIHELTPYEVEFLARAKRPTPQEMRAWNARPRHRRKRMGPDATQPKDG